MKCKSFYVGETVILLKSVYISGYIDGDGVSSKSCTSTKVFKGTWGRVSEIRERRGVDIEGSVTANDYPKD